VRIRRALRDSAELCPVECAGDNWDMHVIDATLPHGGAVLRIALTNDLYRPPRTATSRSTASPSSAPSKLH